MPNLRKDKTAVSEVIGALMLTLIVVVAASSFAVYVAEKQKVQQDNDKLLDQKKQESIQVLSIQPSPNATGASWDELNFTVSSNHVGDSEIKKIVINEFIVRSYIVTRFSPNTGVANDVPMDYTENLKLDPRETVILRINYSGLFESPHNFSTNLAITMSLHTELNNIFQKSFLPPTSLISIGTQSWFNTTAGKFEQYVVLDGSASQQVGGGYIVTWHWKITNETGVTKEFMGQKVRFDFPVNGGIQINYTIELLVENNYGMISSSNIPYTYG
jgi:hypothetical protein